MLGFLKGKKTPNNYEELNILTEREVEVLKKLMEGYTMSETSRLLDVKYSTVNSHTKSIYKKLNVNSRAQLIVKYHKILK